MDFNMVGPAIALGLSCMGCCVGCWIAGAASHAAMARTEEGHGKYIGMAAAPSSQVIYGFLLMLQMSKAIQAGTLSPISAIAIGTFSGMAFVFSSIFQGEGLCDGDSSLYEAPRVYGKCFAAIGIIESLLYLLSFSPF